MTSYFEICIIELPKAIKEYKTNKENGALQWMMFLENPEDMEVTKIMEENEKKAAKPVVNRTVRVDIEKLDVLMNLVSELIIAKNSLVSASSSEGMTGAGFNEQIEYLESVTTNLHESVMKVRMVPIESVVSKFPRNSYGR